MPDVTAFVWKAFAMRYGEVIDRRRFCERGVLHHFSTKLVLTRVQADACSFKNRDFSSFRH